MMIKRLGLKNFRSWKELDIELAPITIFFGANNSGKSSLLYSLLALKQTADSFDRKQAFNFGRAEKDYVDVGSFRDVVFRHDPTQALSVGLIWLPSVSASEWIWGEDEDTDAFQNESGVDHGGLSYNVSWNLVDDQVVISQLEYQAYDLQLEFRMWRIEAGRYKSSVEDPQSVLETYGFEDSVEHPEYLSAPESCYAIPSAAAYSAGVELLMFNSQFEELMDDIAYIGPLREYPKRVYLWTQAPGTIGPRGEGTLEALIAAERHVRSSQERKADNSDLLKYVLNWMKQLGLVEELSIKAIDEAHRFYEPRVRPTRDVSTRSIVDVGFGVSQVLPIVTQLFFVPEGSIVLLEQPELHLHPSAQFELADLFLTVAQERNLQLIIESHSEHLLTRLQRRIAEVDHKFATPENIRLYFCEMGEEGSQIQPVKINEFGEITNWPEDFFGDQVGNLQAMSEAGFARRREMTEGDASQ
jgi:predicted ATPase